MSVCESVGMSVPAYIRTCLSPKWRVAAPPNFATNAELIEFDSKCVVVSSSLGPARFLAIKPAFIRARISL